YSSIFQYSTVRSSADLLSRMKAQGITHIFAPTRPIEQTFAKASLLWPGTDLGGILQGLLDAGNVVQIYNNANARVVKSRAMGLSEKSECYIYKVRYNE
nr:hypothetical protein [Chitinispirillaceae bacterium]